MGRSCGVGGRLVSSKSSLKSKRRNKGTLGMLSIGTGTYDGSDLRGNGEDGVVGVLEAVDVGGDEGGVGLEEGLEGEGRGVLVLGGSGAGEVEEVLGPSDQPSQLRPFNAP